MGMPSERRNNGDYYSVGRPSLMDSSSSFELLPISSSPASSSSFTPLPLSGGGGVGYIEHTISKFDTLAGVAIKYGVEVVDIKRINGLVTDLQMFALKSIQIPLPGRHPPSPSLVNGGDSQGSSSSEQTPPRRHSDLFDSLQSLKLKPSPNRKVSPAMSSLQGYYGLKPTNVHSTINDGFEMVSYRRVRSHYLEDGPFAKALPLPSNNPPLSLHRKTKSLANGLSEQGNPGENNTNGDINSDNWADKILRRRQKFENNFENSPTPVLVLKEDNANSSGGFSTVAGKGLALRPKAASRIVSDAEATSNFVPIGLCDSVDCSGGVRKSSSTSSLQDSDNNTGPLSSFWPTSKWSLKTDLQALSTAAITRPIFDGLPKPITGRRNKAALD